MGAKVRIYILIKKPKSHSFKKGMNTKSRLQFSHIHYLHWQIIKYANRNQEFRTKGNLELF